MIEELLFRHLTRNQALVALVDNRIYPLVLPQNPTIPAIAYQRISTQMVLDRDDAHLQRPRFQFDCYDRRAIQAWRLADALEEALAALKGQDGDPRIDCTLLDGRTDLFDPDTNLYRVSIDAFIWFEKG